MKFLKRMSEIILKFDERFGFPFAILFFSMSFQLVADVLLMSEVRGLFEYPLVLVPGMVWICIFLYRIWQKSEYRHRTVVAVLMALNTIGDLIFAFGGILIVRGALIPLDVLWLIGLVNLRYGGPNKKPFRGFVIKEM